MGATLCRTCGRPMSAGANFCRSCGARNETPSDTGPAYTTPVVPPPQSVQQFQAAAAPANVLTPTPAPDITTPKKTIRLSNAHVAILAAITGVILIAAILAGTSSAPKPKLAGDIVGQLPFGPEGGTQTFDNGLGKMKVPKGALDKRETIIVRRTVIRDRVRAQTAQGIPLIFPPGTLVAYSFGPVTIVLNRPIAVTLALPDPRQTGIVFVTSNGQITFFRGNVGRRTITFRINSLDLSRPGAVVQT